MNISMSNNDHMLQSSTTNQHMMGNHSNSRYHLNRDSSRPNELHLTSMERHQLNEKLAQAEQDLEYLTREMENLRHENRFLVRMNKQVTRHASKQEQFRLDLRKRSNYGDQQAVCQFSLKVCKDLQIFALIDLR